MLMGVWQVSPQMRLESMYSTPFTVAVPMRMMLSRVAPATM